MKFQGKVLNWNDEKGFGFVEPNGGGKRAFVHIKAFKPRSRRPVNGEVIVYELVQDNNNRYKAENIQFARDARHLKKTSQAKKGSHFGEIFIALFCAVLLTSTYFGKLPLIITGIYIVMSLIAFATYAIDKSAAQKNHWRIKESTLHLLSLIGGWPGAFFAQKKLRHKSSKKEFKRVYWVTIILNLSGFFWIHTEKGINVIKNVLYPLFNG